LYVDPRGFDPGGRAMDPAEAVRRFLDALEVPPGRVPADVDAQTALYRSLLADKRMLIVLDNARDAVQVRPLLPAGPGCLVLITSRNRLSSLVAVEGAHPLMLDLFTTVEAQDALTDRLGLDRVTAEPKVADEIVDRCARLPLALAVVAARAAMYPELRRPWSGKWPPHRAGWTSSRTATANQRPGGVLLVLSGPDLTGGPAVPAAEPPPGPGCHHRGRGSTANEPSSSCDSSTTGPVKD
jgi:NB-ARC domain